MLDVALIDGGLGGMSLTEAAIRNSYLRKGSERAEPDNLGAAIAPEKTKTPATRIRRSEHL
jgi:hypothetical protein